jgi:transcriptional regulator with XRE-family HTH domain
VKSSRRPPSLRIIFSRKVRVLRLERGYSQEKLAELAGIDRTYVSSIERGLRNVSIDNIERLCKALGTSPAHMLTHD